MGKPTIPRICVYCGKAFLARASVVNKGMGNYCSFTCYQSWRDDNRVIHRRNTPAICAQCGKPFMVDGYVRSKGHGRYCSHACWGDARATTRVTRFWGNVLKNTNPDGCWLWTSSVDAKGYGRVTVGQVRIPAHRFSWELHYGAIPPRLWVLHHCDTPNCVRPDHLFLGDSDANVADMVSKGRNKHKLTPDNVKEIRRLYATGQYRQIDLGKMFGVKQPCIKSVILRQTWKHILP